MGPSCLSPPSGVRRRCRVRDSFCAARIHQLTCRQPAMELYNPCNSHSAGRDEAPPALSGFTQPCGPDMTGPCELRSLARRAKTRATVIVPWISVRRIAKIAQGELVLEDFSSSSRSDGPITGEANVSCHSSSRRGIRHI